MNYDGVWQFLVTDGEDLDPALQAGTAPKTRYPALGDRLAVSTSECEVAQRHTASSLESSTGPDGITVSAFLVKNCSSSGAPIRLWSGGRKKWSWESSREIRYFENETGNGEGLYRWLFREPGGARVICVEKWEGEPFEVRIARRLNQRDITVYRAAHGV